MNIETFGSGSLTLDLALGGGYPRGRVVEVYGPESSGKTTLALHAVAEMQRLGGECTYDAQEKCSSIYEEKFVGCVGMIYLQLMIVFLVLIVCLL